MPASLLLLISSMVAAPVSAGHGSDAAVFLQSSCLDCHGNGSRKGKLDLDPPDVPDLSALPEDARPPRRLTEDDVAALIAAAAQRSANRGASW